jgi:ERCC4-type nuclease
MTIKLLVDNRECKFKEILISKSKELNYECFNLESGDFIIQNDDNPIVVIERKTIADLAGSIKDGRYKNQKLNLLSRYNKENVYYIIEGSFGGFYESNEIQRFAGIERKNIIGAIINTMIRDGVKVITTKDLNETYDLVINMYERINNDPSKYLTHGTEEENCQKRKGNNVFYNMLCQIPGVSNKVANVITSKYNSFNSFYEALKDLDDTQKLKVLKEIKLDSNRVISKTTLSNIIVSLYGT